MNRILSALTLISSLIVLTLACGVDASSDAELAQNKEKKIKITPSAPAKDRVIFEEVDQLPLFGDCVDLDCSNQKLIAYIVDKMKYPDEAKKLGLEGKVIVQFVVNTDGSVSDIDVKRSLGGGATEEALSVVNSFNDGTPVWSPGVANGKEVPFRYTLPFSFKLDS